MEAAARNVSARMVVYILMVREKSVYLRYAEMSVDICTPS